MGPKVRPDDVLGARPIVITSRHELPQVVLVLLSDSLWDCQPHGDLNWHAQLVKLETGVWRDDGPRREVNSLTHQVSSQSSFLALETGTNGLDWLS